MIIQFEGGNKMKNFPVILIALLLVACAPSQQVIKAVIAQTQAVWTKVSTQTAFPTQTVYPTQTPEPTIIVTQVVVWTPTPRDISSSCKPINNMDYSDNSKIMIELQAYVLTLPNVKSVSYVIPEKLYVNTNSELFFVTYVSSDDGKLYSRRYIVYLREFGWNNAVFSIDGQCWIDPPYQ
jgi:hypothetical protein